MFSSLIPFTLLDPLSVHDKKQEWKHVGAGQTPSVEAWKVLTLPRLGADIRDLEGLISLLVCVN